MQHAPISAHKGAIEVGDDAEKLGRAGQPHSAGNELPRGELADLGSQVARLRMRVDRDAEGPALASAELGPLVRGILQARFERTNFFASKLFSDPAWDMLLDLFAAQLAQIRVSLTSLCTASNSPTSTALRWISALEKEGLIERRVDPLDGRRIFISLTTKASDALCQYFDSLKGRAVI